MAGSVVTDEERLAEAFAKFDELLVDLRADLHEWWEESMPESLGTAPPELGYHLGALTSLASTLGAVVRHVHDDLHSMGLGEGT